MNERLKKLLELRAKAFAAVDELKAARKAITDKVEAEQRDDLSEEEAVEYRAKTAAIKTAQEKVKDLDEQVRELEDEVKRSGELDAATRSITRATVTVTNEARTYERGNGKSYVQDLLARQFGVGDEDSTKRLHDHAKEVRALNRTDGTGGSRTVATAAA